MPPANPTVITKSQTTATPDAGFEALAAKADEARSSNRLDQAVTLYNQALALRPSWAEGWWNLGTVLYDRNDYAGAARSFKKAADLDPKAGMATIMLGLCEFELGDDASALEHLEEGKRLGLPKDPQLRHVMLYHEGVLLTRNGSFEDALEDLRALCKEGVQSDDLTAALGRAVLRIRAPKLLPAETTGGEVVTRVVGRAECFAAQGKFDEARRIYTALAEDHPQVPKIHYAYGRFLLELHDTVDATAQFQQEIKNDPASVFARLEIAAVKYRIDSAAGLPYAEEAVKLNPRLPFGHYLLGLLLADTKHYQRAIGELTLARQSFPEDPNLYFALGTAYARTGRRAEAAEAWAEFARLNRAAGQQGPLYYGQGPSGTAQPQLGGEPVTPH